MVNFMTEPVAGTYGYDMQAQVLYDAWVSSNWSPVPDQLEWDTLKHLRMVPYGIYLAFEQGRNSPAMALAWRDDAGYDLADSDQMGYELHAVHEEGHRDQDPPALVQRFHEPVDRYIAQMAELLDRNLATAPAEHRPALFEAFMRKIAGFILARIDLWMVLRPRLYDDGGQLEGYGPDVAPGLKAAWDAFLNDEKKEI